MNGRLSVTPGSNSPFASLLSVFTGALATLIFFIVDGVILHDTGSNDASSAPWWAWIGGFIGIGYVIVVTTTVPLIGVALVQATVVTIQLVTSVVLDQLSLVGLPQRTATSLRTVGCVIAIAGVILLTQEALLVPLFQSMVARYHGAKASKEPADTHLEGDSAAALVPKADADANEVPLVVVEEVMTELPLSASTSDVTEATVSPPVEETSAKTQQPAPSQSKAKRVEFYVAILCDAVVGFAIAVQTGTNAEMGRRIGKSGAAMLNLGIALGVASIYYLIRTRGGRDTQYRKVLKGAPWWLYLGGVFGAVYVSISIIVTQHLGSGTTVSLVVLAQLLSAIVFDHFGAFGLKARRVTPVRIFGAMLILAGVLLITLG
ncbi:hypothetical protein BJ742DRAFT_804053 [Cladochytrium replicatum]|nr:hypothetical protein BJ742DRAFT_804053 [Cladochytrium replicatum]